MDQVSQIFSGINLYCDTHKKLDLIYLSPISDDPNPFNCATCAAKRYMDMIPFISIQEILTSDQDTETIQNWPPGIKDDHIKLLKNEQTDSIKAEFISGIMDFYDNLSNQINIAINESKKEQLNKLDILFGPENMIDLYNKLFKRKELVQIFQNFSAQSKDEYNNLLASLNAIFDEDLKTLQKRIKEKKEEEIKFLEFQENSIKSLSKKFSSILNDLFLTLFKSDKNDISEKDDIQIIIQQLIEEHQAQIKNQAIQPYSLESRQLIMQSKSSLDITHWSNLITEVKNINQKDCSCYGQYSSNQDSIYNFKIKFKNYTSFQHFGFGLLVHEKKKKEKQQVYREFWKKVVEITNENMSDGEKDQYNKEDLTFIFSINMREKMVKIESKFFEEGLIHKQIDIHSKNNYQILFDLTKECAGFQICEYSIE